MKPRDLYFNQQSINNMIHAQAESIIDRLENGDLNFKSGDLEAFLRKEIYENQNIAIDNIDLIENMHQSMKIQEDSIAIILDHFAH